jgi:hypothetical protein
MRQSIKIFNLLWLFTLLISCSKQGDLENIQTTNSLIGFGTSINQGSNFLSRGNAFTNDFVGYANPIMTMRMFCAVTENSNFDASTHTFNHIYNAEISRETAREWYIMPANSSDVISNKYWVGAEKHSFFAFAPYQIPGAVITSPINTTGTPSIQYTIPTNNVKDHIDLLYASHLNIKATNSVPLFFKHALSKVYFSVKMKNEVTLPNKDKINILSLSLKNIWTSGSLHFKKSSTPATNPIEGNENDYTTIEWRLEAGANNKTEQWSVDANSTDLSHLKTQIIAAADAELATGEVAVTEIPIIKMDNALFMIPQPFTESNTILTITYSHYIDNGTGSPKTEIKKVYTPILNQWTDGTAYLYTIAFNPYSNIAPITTKTVVTDYNHEDISQNPK